MYDIVALAAKDALAGAGVSLLPVAAPSFAQAVAATLLVATLGLLFVVAHRRRPLLSGTRRQAAWRSLQRRARSLLTVLRRGRQRRATQRPARSRRSGGRHAAPRRGQVSG